MVWVGVAPSSEWEGVRACLPASPSAAHCQHISFTAEHCATYSALCVTASSPTPWRPLFPTGDALVCGTSLAEAGGMDRVRPLMGVCPQFDVLWEQLTGREHLMLFGAIKGAASSTGCHFGWGVELVLSRRAGST